MINASRQRLEIPGAYKKPNYKNCVLKSISLLILAATPPKRMYCRMRGFSEHYFEPPAMGQI